MLFRLLIVRFCPFAVMGFWKERRPVKRAVVLLLIFYIINFFIAIGKIIVQKGFISILYIPLSMFPHYIFYGFAVWMLIRCIWQAWSERVWKRIYLITLICVLLGVFMENNVNPKILQIFFKIFK